MNSLLPAEFSKMETFRRATLRKSACDPHPPPSPGDGGGYIRWAEIRDVSSWAMERVVYFIGAGHADVLGGASGHVASRFTHSPTWRKGRSRNCADDD